MRAVRVCVVCSRCFGCFLIIHLVDSIACEFTINIILVCLLLAGWVALMQTDCGVRSSHRHIQALTATYSITRRRADRLPPSVYLILYGEYFTIVRLPKTLNICLSFICTIIIVAVCTIFSSLLFFRFISCVCCALVLAPFVNTHKHNTTEYNE